MIVAVARPGHRSRHDLDRGLLFDPRPLAGLDAAVVAEHKRRPAVEHPQHGALQKRDGTETPRAIWLGICTRRNNAPLDSVGPPSEQLGGGILVPSGGFAAASLRSRQPHDHVAVAFAGPAR
jgi:hypothetical protein